jgi:hypothetical protein
VKRSEITMQSSEPPTGQPSPAPRIGEAERSEHRPPAPSPAEHNAAYVERWGHAEPAGFDSAGQHARSSH